MTEEVWSWWQDGSVHRAPWPNSDELWAELGTEPADEDALPVISDVLAAIRKAKSQARRPMREPIRRAAISDVAGRLQALDVALDDLRDAGRIERLERVEADEFKLEVEFASAEPGFGAQRK